jgi:hypothetical protein
MLGCVGQSFHRSGRYSNLAEAKASAFQLSAEFEDGATIFEELAIC